MEICHSCRRPILARQLVWRDVLVSRQTHWEPAEYDSVPLHADCADVPEQDAAYERAAAKYDGDEGNDGR